jgi:MYXO-CTERM domain-containing protein
VFYAERTVIFSYSEIEYLTAGFIRILQVITFRMACGMILLAMSLEAESIVIYDNTQQISVGEDSIQDLGPLYDSFSTGTDSGELTKLTLLLQGDNTSAGFTSVDLYADSGSDTAGSFITNLGVTQDSNLSSSGGPIVVTLAVDPDLRAFTRYWIGLTGSNTTGEWFWTTDADGATGVNGESFQNIFGTFPDSEGGYQMSVGITPAPDPPTFLLGALALGTLTLFRRRLEI